MSNQDTGKLVGLGAAKKSAQPAAAPKPGAPASGLTGLGTSGGKGGGLTGLGAGGGGGGLTGLGTSGGGGGLTGLGTSGGGGGLTGLGSGGGGGSLTGLGTSGGGGGLTGLGTSGGGGSLTGLGSGGGGGSLTGLGSGASRPAPREPVAPGGRKAGITIGESAAGRIRKLLEDRGTPEAALRIRVRGGGCTGLQYDMEFADEPKERDRVFAEHGVKIIVDPKSYIFLIGTELVYETTLLESGFKLQNPNVKKACGCGESFTV